MKDGWNYKDTVCDLQKAMLQMVRTTLMNSNYHFKRFDQYATIAESPDSEIGIAFS